MNTNIRKKLTEYGTGVTLSKEDERSAALARLAQQGNYDEGGHPVDRSCIRKDS